MRSVVLLALAAGVALPAWAQQFRFNLSHLESKASDSVDISLTGSTLQFAAKFLDSKDPEEAEVKKLIAGLEGIYVKSFEFKDAGVWSPADLERVRTQLREPEWSRIVGVKSAEEGDTAEVYVRTLDKKVAGVAILVSGPKELTVVNIAGAIDLDKLANMSGHLGLPKLSRTPPGKNKKQE